MANTYPGLDGSAAALLEGQQPDPVLVEGLPVPAAIAEVSVGVPGGREEVRPLNPEEEGIAEKVYGEALDELYGVLTPATEDADEVVRARREAEKHAKRRQGLTLRVHRLEGPEGAEVWAQYQTLDTLLHSGDEADWGKATEMLDRWRSVEDVMGTVGSGVFSEYFYSRLETNPRQRERYDEHVGGEHPATGEEPEPITVAEDELAADAVPAAASTSANHGGYVPESRVYTSIFSPDASPEDRELAERHLAAIERVEREGGELEFSVYDALVEQAHRRSLHSDDPANLADLDRFIGVHEEIAQDQRYRDEDGDLILTGDRLVTLFPEGERPSRSQRRAAHRRRIGAAFTRGGRRIRRWGQASRALVTRAGNRLRPEPTDPANWKALVDDLNSRKPPADDETQSGEPKP